MGQYDYRNYIAEIKLRDNVSDRRFDIVFLMKPTIKEYNKFEKDLLLEAPVYNARAEELILFFIKYKNGLYKPDLWNNFEPVNKPLDENDISRPISSLAFPGGCVYLKKKHLFHVDIENETWGIGWVDNDFLIPKRVLPEYLTTIRVVFPKKKSTDIDAIVQLMKDIVTKFNADNGKVYYQETHDVIASI